MGHCQATAASSLIYAATTVWLSFMAKDKVTVTDDVVNGDKRTESNRNKRKHEQYQIEQLTEANNSAF
jgi:hypothetical protein